MRKYFLPPLLLLLLFFACKKNDQIKSSPGNQSEVKFNSSNLKSNLNVLSAVYPTAANDNDSVETPTIIDYQLPNPYTIPNMQQAYYNATGQNITPAVTNLYMRFKPSDVGQLQILDSVAGTQGFELFDEPLDYHVVQEGDYYQDPSIPMEQITWQYAVVPPNFQPPAGIQYELLASIHIPTDMLVEAEAERLVGLNADGDDYVNGGASAMSSTGAKSSIQPNVTQCADGYHWDYNLRRCVPNDCADGYHWDASQGKCVPDAPPPPPPSYIPGGRIRVWDSSLDGPPPASPFDPNSMAQPLRTAHIIARRWFKVDRTYTDNNGIFQVTKNFRNKVKLYVEMKNQYSSIRGVRGLRVWQMFYAIKKKIGVFTSTSINTVNYTFLQGNTVNAMGSRYWAGATTLNAVQEHRDYATQFGFDAPPTSLNIYLTNWGMTSGLASTPLFNKRYWQDLPQSFINTYLVFLSAHYVAGGIEALLAVYARVNVDMAIDYQADISRFKSDRLKETIYHELSHASHYTRVGTNWYSNFVNAELNEIVAHPSGSLNPYGPANGADAPIIAVGEGWAYHMGHFLADQRYGTQATCTAEQPDAGGYGINYCPNGTNHPHIDVLENFDPNLPSDPFNWIPKGLLEDMMDNTPFETVVNDQVAGYTIQQFFNALQSDINSPQQYRDRLLQQNGNNQAAQVIDLFAQYHYN